MRNAPTVIVKNSFVSVGFGGLLTLVFITLKLCNVISVGFGGLLTLVFITLKLCNVITWSWLWVLSPLWIPFVVTLGIIAIFLLFALILGIFLGIGKVFLSILGNSKK